MIDAKCRQSDRPSANLQAAIRSRIRQFSDATYINIDLEGQLETERVSDIFGRALVIQNELAQLAVPGEHDVVLCMESALDLVPAAWACIFNNHNILPVHFQSSGLRNVDLASRLASLAPKLSNPVLLTTNDIEPRIATYADGKFSQILCVESRKTMLRSREVSSPSSSKTHPATCGHILVQTSGATADPKIVAITYDAYLNRLHALHGSQNVATTVLSLFPFESVGGLSSLLWPRTARNCYLQPERLARSPLELLRIVEKFQIERVSLTSSLAAKLIDAIDRNGHSFDLSHLTTLGFGAEQIIPEIVSNLCRRLAGLGASDLKVVTGYGMTETGLVCYDSPRPWEQAFRATYSPVPVGTSAPGYALRIVDDAGASLSHGTVGRIEVRSDDRLFCGYYNDPVSTALTFTSDGWFKTGDLGFIENDALTITGREKSIIIINGRNISLEQVEAPLRPMVGVYQALLAALPVRSSDSATDELAVFFVPEIQAPDQLDKLCRAMMRETAARFGVTISHLVPLRESDFPRTATDKTRRRDLADVFERDECSPYRVQETAKLNTVQKRLSEAEVRLTDLWERVLQTKSIAPDDNFYDLGGDSFSSAALICCIEEEFDCQLPIEAFFNDPTIANMAALLANAPRKSLIADHTNQQRHILRDLQNYLGCWKGKRLVPGGLIVGANTSGSMDPIFWVFQEQNEFERLSIHLGSDQPLYGMRSLVGLMRIRNYPEVLDVIATSYAKEILTLQSSRIILGGNCQGGIIALAIARKLNQVGRAPAPLILMEWNFNYGRYSGPTVLLYGRNSHTAKSFESAAKPDPDWRADFPRRIVIPIEEGRHGEFFGEKYIMNLAATLKASLRAQIPTTTSSPPPPDSA